MIVTVGDLQQAGSDGDAPDCHEVAQGELDPEGEEEKNDPDVGEDGDLLLVAHEPRGERPDRDPRDEIPDDRRLAQPGGDRPTDKSGQHRDAQVQDEPELLAQRDVEERGHAPIIAGVARVRPCG